MDDQVWFTLQMGIIKIPSSFSTDPSKQQMIFPVGHATYITARQFVLSQLLDTDNIT